MLSHAFRIEFFRFTTQKLSNSCDDWLSPLPFFLPETPWSYKGLS